MKTTAGNGSIEKFINHAKTIKKDDCIDIIYDIIKIGDELLQLQTEFDELSDTKELYEKIVLCNATLSKKGRNSHILINNMNIDTIIKYLKKHLITKINLLKKDPTKLVQAVGSNFSSFVEQLLNILEKMNDILPFENHDDNDIDNNTNDNDKIYYKLMFDVKNNCFYEILENGIFIVQPERLYDFANMQKSFFENNRPNCKFDNFK